MQLGFLVYEKRKFGIYLYGEERIWTKEIKRKNGEKKMARIGKIINRRIAVWIRRIQNPFSGFIGLFMRNLWYGTYGMIWSGPGLNFCFRK